MKISLFDSEGSRHKDGIYSLSQPLHILCCGFLLPFIYRNFRTLRESSQFVNCLQKTSDMQMPKRCRDADDGDNEGNPESKKVSKWSELGLDDEFE